MCGIFGILGPYRQTISNPAELVEKLKHRGSEYSDVVVVKPDAFVLGVTGIALKPEKRQPFSHEGTLTVCDCAIYNNMELASRWDIGLPEDTSDCSVLTHLASRLDMTALCRTLDGEFAFLYADNANDVLYIARDPYGIRPLFYGSFLEPGAERPTHMWASEIKGLSPKCSKMETFQPGTWRKYKISTGELLETQEYYSHPCMKLAAFSDKIVNGRKNGAAALRCALIMAVKKRLLSDYPIGAILNGVNSSLVAAIAAKELAKEGKKLYTIAVGIPDSPQLILAETVARHINSVHCNLVMRPEEMLNAIPKVIEAIESYDVTTVRASVGKWAIGKFIREHTKIKVVLSGDGCDEIGGGYFYSHAAPSNEEFEMESDRLLRKIHLYDVLQSERSMAAHGLEARMPFLDKNVVATWKAIDTTFCRPVKGTQIDKQILCEAFKEGEYLPEAVLWRKKEEFASDVFTREDPWNKCCSEYAKSAEITMPYIEMMTKSWYNSPTTEEAFHYRRMFEEYYGAAAANVLPCMWMPRWADL